MKDIFISYRRDGGDSLAQLLYTRLSMDGYSVFYDVETLRSGKFNEAIYERIDECTDFLLILPKDGLNRCESPEDWVRLEIEYALEKQKNIIPVMMRGFEFPKNLPDSINDIRNYNGIEANHKFFEAVMDTLEHKLIISKPSKPVRTEDGNTTDETAVSEKKILCPVCKSEKLDEDDRMMDLINISDAIAEAAAKVYLFTGPIVLLFAILFVIYTSQKVSPDFVEKLDKIISYIPLLNSYVLKGKDCGTQFMKLTLITFAIPMLMFLASFIYDKIRRYYYKKSIELKIYNVTYTCLDCGHNFTMKHGPEELISRNKKHKTEIMYILYPLLVILAAVILSPFALVVGLTIIVAFTPILLLGILLDLITKREKFSLRRVKNLIIQGLKVITEDTDGIRAEIKKVLRIPILDTEENIN